MDVKSCDTFVVMPDLTSNKSVIFGKNSDRPKDEVQEVILGTKNTNSKVKCTYIEIDESSKPTYSIILSKPAWMWGAEMGANEKNVCIGNEAIWTKYNDGDADSQVKRLLGMDLVRLGLERAASAEEALNVITNLLETYGQGGPCSETDLGLSYQNSFLIADPAEAWVLETCGKFWAAEKITSNFRNISNNLTISTKIDKMSDGLLEKAKELKLWDGEGDFDFAKCFSDKDADERQANGEKLLAELTANKNFKVDDMFKILRNKESGICRTCDHGFPTQGSQVSELSATVSSVHWFTATPDPSASVFKPFVFTPNARISDHTASSASDPKHQHTLYKLHSQHYGVNENILEVLRGMENNCVAEINEFFQKNSEGSAELSELDDLMKDCVETEVKYYR